MSFWHDKVILVTGGSAGLGRAIAEAFAREGAKIALASRSRDKLDSTAVALRQLVPDVLPVVADVTRQEDVERLMAETVAHFGRLDVLVNNVGQSVRGEACETSAEAYRELIEVNFLSAVRCTGAALPHLLSSQGSIVNIGSLASKTASRYLGAYPASKFPLAAYSQQLRLELGPKGVHVLLVCPGPIQRGDSGNRYDQGVADNDLPDSTRQPGAGVKLKGIDPKGLAAAIVRACRRRRAELVVPGYARLLFAISQLWPRLGDWIVNKMTR